MKKVTRPFLLTGLILSLLCFVAYTIYCVLALIVLITSTGLVEGITGAMADMTLMMAIVIMLVPTIFGLLGLIFSAVSFTRINYDPQKFANKKGLVITTFVFDVIEAAFILFGLFNGFDVVSLIMMLVFVLAAVFIMVDVSRNKKLLASDQAQTQQVLPETPEIQKPTDEQNSEQINEKSDQN